MSDLLLKAFDNEKAANLPTMQIGDNVTVYVRINVGDKNERVQMVRGTIIRVRNAGNNANFTVRRIASNGIGVERTFLANSHASRRSMSTATATSAARAFTICASAPARRRACAPSAFSSRISPPRLAVVVDGRRGRTGVRDQVKETLFHLFCFGNLYPIPG